MLTPDYKSFLQFSREATLVPVAKTLNADLLTPVGAFLSIAGGQKYGFLLESAEAGERVGRYTFVGAQPRVVLTARARELSIRYGVDEERSRGHLMDVLREHLRQYRHASVPGLPRSLRAAWDISPTTWSGNLKGCPKLPSPMSICRIASLLFTIDCWHSITSNISFTSSRPRTCVTNRRAKRTTARSRTSMRSSAS